MEIIVCVGDSCHLKGSEVVVTRFKSMIKEQKLENKINLKGSFCMGRCSDQGVTVQIDDQFYKTDYEKADEFFNKTILPLANK